MTVTRDDVYAAGCTIGALLRDGRVDPALTQRIVSVMFTLERDAAPGAGAASPIARLRTELAGVSDEHHRAQLSARARWARGLTGAPDITDN